MSNDNRECVQGRRGNLWWFHPDRLQWLQASTRHKSSETDSTRLRMEFTSVQCEEEVLGAGLFMMGSCETLMRSSLGGLKCWMLLLKMEGIVWIQGLKKKDMTYRPDKWGNDSFGRRFRKGLPWNFFHVFYNTAGGWLLLFWSPVSPQEEDNGDWVQLVKKKRFLSRKQKAFLQDRTSSRWIQISPGLLNMGFGIFSWECSYD